MLSHLKITPSTSSSFTSNSIPPPPQALPDTPSTASEELPSPKMPNLPDRSDDDIGTGQQDETAPLLVPPPPQTQTGPGTNGLEEIEERLESRGGAEVATKRDAYFAFIAVGSLLTITMYTWILVFSQPNPISTLRFFAFHPPLQTLGVLFFGIGILTLQPTSKSVPRARERGLKIHQIIQLGLGVPCILVGAAMMILNKIDHGAAHFTTWHAKFGLISVIWILAHSFLGGSSVWFGGRAFGGQERGKALWKWHRLSGYLLLAFLLTTIHLAGGHSDWVTLKRNAEQRFWIYLFLPIVAFFGVIARLRKDKLPFFQKP